MSSREMVLKNTCFCVNVLSLLWDTLVFGFLFRLI